MGKESFIVAAVSAQLIDIAEAKLKSAGITCTVISGRISSQGRQQAVTQFQSGAVQVILLVLATGAEGITLTRSRVILFMQEDWRPDLNDQAVDRAHRIGSEIHDSIQVIVQITPGTIEERKPAILARKHGRIEDVLQDRATLARLLGSSVEG